MQKIRKIQTGSSLYYNQKYITPIFLGKSIQQIANEYQIAQKRYKDEQFARAAVNRVEPQLTSDNRSIWQRQQDQKITQQASKKEQEVKNQEAAGKAATGLLAMTTPSTYAGFAWVI